jgi:PKD domain
MSNPAEYVETTGHRAGAVRALVLVPACLALLLWLCPSANAAPGWLATVNLSQPTSESFFPVPDAVAVTPQGEAVATWARREGSNLVQVSVKPQTGTAWQAPVTLSEAGEPAEEAEVAVDAGGEQTVLWRRYDGSSWRIQASTRSPGGSWQTPVTLSEGGHGGFEPRVAMDAGGDAVAIWFQETGSADVIETSARPAGGSWQAPATLSAASGSNVRPEIAMDPSGDAVAVWEHLPPGGGQTVVQASEMPAGGSWQTPLDLSETSKSSYAPSVAIDPEGDAVAAWEHEAGGLGIIQASSRPPGGAWQTPVSLSQGGESAFDAQAALDAQGDAVVAWTRDDGSSFVIQASSMPAGGGWGAPANLSESGRNAFNPSLAIDARGDAVAAWNREELGGEVTQAAVRPLAGGSWQTAVAVSETNSFTMGERNPAAAIDSQGDAVVVWPEGQGGKETVQSSSYVAGGPFLEEVAIPSSAAVGQLLSFAVTSIDPWTSLGQTAWSFGDGGSAAGTGATHAYAAPGSYEVTVLGEDALGNRSEAQGTVIVKAPPANKEAPATPPAAAVPPPASRVLAPALDLLTKAPQPIINAHVLTLTVQCGVACTAQASGWMRLPGSARMWRLGRASGGVPEHGSGQLHLALPARLRSAVRSYLLRHPHTKLEIHVFIATVVDGHASQHVEAMLPVWTYPGFR